MNFVSLVDEGIVLGDTLQSQFFHEIDLVGLLHPLVLESLNSLREGGREQHDLARGWGEGQNAINTLLKLGRKELIGLVHDKGRALRQVDDLLLGQIQQAARRRDNDVHGGLETNDIVLQISTTSSDNNVVAEVLAQSTQNS